MSEMIIRKKNEAELKIARDEAESHRAASSSHAGHELRTPMILLSFCTAIFDGYMTEIQRKGVVHIMNGKHLLKLINESWIFPKLNPANSP